LASPSFDAPVVAMQFMQKIIQRSEEISPKLAPIRIVRGRPRTRSQERGDECLSNVFGVLRAPASTTNVRVPRVPVAATKLLLRGEVTSACGANQSASCGEKLPWPICLATFGVGEAALRRFALRIKRSVIHTALIELEQPTTVERDLDTFQLAIAVENLFDAKGGFTDSLRGTVSGETDVAAEETQPPGPAKPRGRSEGVVTRSLRLTV
jgi:hypothetical protein